MPLVRPALRLLRTMDVPHRVDTVNSDADFEAWKSRSGMRTFPQIFVDGRLIGGYDNLTDLHASGELQHSAEQPEAGPSTDPVSLPEPPPFWSLKPWWCQPWSILSSASLL